MWQKRFNYDITGSRMCREKNFKLEFETQKMEMMVEVIERDTRLT